MFTVEMQLVYRVRSGAPPNLKTCVEDLILEFCPQRVGQAMLTASSSSYKPFVIIPSALCVASYHKVKNPPLLKGHLMQGL